MAFISIMLGIINLFPIPVLDGGHLVFLTFEALFGKPVPKKILLILNNFFIVCLIMLTFVVLFNDFWFWSDRKEILNSMLNND